LDKIAETPEIGIRASANMWKKPITSVTADGEANLRAARPIVKKNMSVPNTTAVLRMPTRDTAHIAGQDRGSTSGNDPALISDMQLVAAVKNIKYLVLA
jgi:hypothetical protein